MKKTIYFLTVFSVCTMLCATFTPNVLNAQTPPSYVPTDGLVGWWPFNGNANDESGNGNNGTVNGATLTEDRFGEANAAYGFDGVDDKIEINGETGNFGMSNFTISCWVRDTSSTNGGIVVAKRNSYGWGNFFQISWLNGPAVFVSQENSPVNYDEYISQAELLDSWHHLAVVREEQIIKVYLDCELYNTMPTEIIQNINNDALLIFGCRYYSDFGQGVVEFINANLDDIGIWNRALSEDEISGLCQANLCFEYITVTDTLIINLGPMGFNPVTYQNTILMYPNPTNDQLTIDYGDFASLAGYTLKIFNSIGEETHSANINQQQEVLQLGTWGGAGTYQVVIYNAQGVPVDTRTIVLQ